jgi:hypothetical protein
MDPAGLEALAAALEVPFGARREHDLFTHRGGRRVNAVRNGNGSGGQRRLNVLDHVLALRLRDHLALPVAIAGALLGVDRTTVSNATTLTRQLIEDGGITPPPATPGTRLRTPAELRDHAQAAGITLIIPGTRQGPPKYTRPRRAEPATHPTQPT